MGNYLSYYVLSIIICVFALSSCEVVDDVNARQQQAKQVYAAQLAEQSQQSDPSFLPPVEANIHCSDPRRDECGLLVKLNAQDEQVDLNVRLHIDEGVIFRSDYNEAVVLDDDGREGHKARVGLMPQESREILFPYQMNQSVLPGAYRVEVVVTNANTLEVFGDTVALVFIYLDDEGTHHMLSSKGEYDNYYINGFSKGMLDISYNIILEDREKPRRGTILVRVDSDHDDYEPVLELTSMGGVKFLPDTANLNQVLEFGNKVTHSFPAIDEGGARIVQFPFEYDKNGQFVDGVYAFVTKLSSGEVEPVFENAPVAIKIVSDPNYREDRWLQEAYLESNLIEEIGVGPAIETTVPQENEELAKQECETKWHSVNFPADADKPHWDLKISEFNGTLCQLYLMKFAGKVYMNWHEFSTLAVMNNENIVTVNDKLQDHEIYLMPRSNMAP